MNNLKTNILIGVVALVLCLVITLTNGINFFLLAIPLLVIILIIYLSGLLKNRFGKTYGITWILLLVFVIPGLWYVISANMPMTSKMIEHKKNKEDLSSFQNYSGGVDAKKEVANYQFRQDSILKEQVSLLLNEGKVDSALALIKQNESTSEKIKNELFSTVTSSQNKSETKSNLNQSNNLSSNSTSKNDFEGQPAVINDPDGYTNIRSGEGANYNILGVVYEGEVFYAIRNNNNDWWRIKTKNGIIGYMHKSRIRFK
jgi:hypothetical protein